MAVVEGGRRNVPNTDRFPLLTVRSATGCGVGSCTMYLQMWAVWSPEAEGREDEREASILDLYLLGLYFVL